MTLNRLIPLAVIAIIAVSIIQSVLQRPVSDVSSAEFNEPVVPNWSAIAAWPSVEAPQVEAAPDPNRLITAIVLDDSGSMGSDIVAAKAAIVATLDGMADDDRVAVLTLNRGTVWRFSSVADARGGLAQALAPIESNGSTPLTSAVSQARALLEAEASIVRGFGTFRVIVTTDGIADDGAALNVAVASLAETTPIQITTIGIGISGGHVLRRNDLGTFVDVANVDALQSALQAAVAENTDFTAITDFGEDG
ncbi:MAG: vWA domain-containing protein [Pseudomonadota bacterium]